MADGEYFSFKAVRQQSQVVWKDPYCGKVLRVAFLFILVPVVLLGWWFRRLPLQVPIFYSRPWGEDQLASPWWLFFLPGLGLLLLLVNSLIGGVVFGLDKLLARILLTAAALFSFLAMFSLFRIFWLIL